MCVKMFMAGLLAGTSIASFAKDAPTETHAEQDLSEIVVTAPRLSGQVDSEFPPELVLDPAAIESYGASNATDLLAALAAQTRSGRGRGGAPVVLVNGKRVSGFAEIRDLPSEAIQRVEVLPEDVALRFGFTADQRVVNFILKDKFRAISGEAEFGGPFSGGRSETELSTTFLAITKTGRINLNAQYDRDGNILESERGIIAFGADQTNFRTLLPQNRALALNGTMMRTVAGNSTATLNLRHDRADTRALLGLQQSGIEPVERDVAQRSFNAGLTLDGNFGRWNWTATATYDQSRTRTLTDRNPATPPDRVASFFTSAGAQYTLTGPLVQLPAGPMTLNIRVGMERRRMRGLAKSTTGLSQSFSQRNERIGRASLDIPLASRRRGVAAVIGDLSINFNGGYRKLSDFGGVVAYGYGLIWSPIRGLDLSASYAAEEAAPSPQQLSDPRLVTPNALVFDFARGASSLVDLVSGGNAGLRAEERRDVKFGASYTPPSLEQLTMSANFFRNRSDHPLSSFPALTPEVEAAFPSRLVRNGVGALTQVDLRPVNFFATRADQLRWGINYAREFGRPQGGARGAAMPGGGFGRGGFGGPGRFGGQGGRWSVSLYHTIKFRDEITLAPGLSPLNLLGGDATGQSGGTPRHAFELEGGWFFRGVGLRGTANYQTGTTVRGLTPASDLEFGSIFNLNLRFFYNFDQRKKLVEKHPFLKGSRMALRFNNLTNSVQDVRDAVGNTPLRYQRGYLDPIGRWVELSFRKIF